MTIIRALIVAFVAQVAAPQQMPTGSIEGLVVRTGTSEPIAGAEVELTRVEPLLVTANPADRNAPGVAPTIFRATTSDDGKFVLKSIPGGRYRLVATRAGGLFVSAEYGQRDPKGRGTTLELAAGQALSGVRLAMAATGAISGRVWDADQDPVPNARVLALEAVYQNGRRVLNTVQAVLTNDFGEYRLFWLHPGRYYVAVMRQDLRAFSFAVHVTTPDQFGRREDASTPTVRERILDDGRSIEETAVLVYFGGGTDERKAQAIEVLPAATVAGVDVPLNAGLVQSRRVKGVVIGSDGQPAANAPIRLVPLQSAAQITLPNAVTDKQGAFNVPGVIPGSYFLVAHVGGSSGYSFHESLLDVGSGSSSVVRIEVADRDLENVAVALKPSFTLAGRLRVDGGVTAKWDVTQARVSITRDPNLLGLPNTQGFSAGRGQRPNGTPLDDGTFVYSGLGEGAYRVDVFGMPTSAYVKAIQWGSVDAKRQGVRLEKAPDAPLDIVVNLDGATLEGATFNEKSETLSNATVVLVPDIPTRSDTHLFKSTATDGAGRFEIKGIPPGAYKVFVWETVPPGAWRDPEFLRDFEPYGTPVILGEGSRQDLRITVNSRMAVQP